MSWDQLVVHHLFDSFLAIALISRLERAYWALAPVSQEHSLTHLLLLSLRMSNDATVLPPELFIVIQCPGSSALHIYGGFCDCQTVPLVMSKNYW